MVAVCVVCKTTMERSAPQPPGDRTTMGGSAPQPPSDRIRVRYEGRYYEFDRDRCKIIFQENPDRWLDAFGEVLDQPR